MSGPTTRANQARKAWLLIICCHTTSAINLEWMEDYSARSLANALHSHADKCRQPAVISSDTGSQMKALARRATRASAKIAQQASTGQTVQPISNQDGIQEGWSNMLYTVNQKFKGKVRWFIAPPGAQSFNGLSEANVKQLKKLLLST